MEESCQYKGFKSKFAKSITFEVIDDVEHAGRYPESKGDEGVDNEEADEE